MNWIQPFKTKLLEVFKRLYPIHEVDKRVEEVTNKLKSLYEKYSKGRMAAKAVASTSISAAAAAPTGRTRNEDDFYIFLKTRRVENRDRSKGQATPIILKF